MKKAWLAALLAVAMVFAAPAVMLRDVSAGAETDQAARREAKEAETVRDNGDEDAEEEEDCEVHGDSEDAREESESARDFDPDPGVESDPELEAQNQGAPGEAVQELWDEEAVQAPADGQGEQSPAVTASADEPGAADYDKTLLITLLDEGTARVMSLWEYLTGVVAGEMTGAFSDDALRAQAVAARTYALRQLSSGKHNGALCSDPGCCQDWIDPKEKSQTPAGAELVQRAGQAVTDTDGWVLTWEGQLIEAVYHSCSGGSTEWASDVWGGECPYLQAVDSPGEAFAPRFTGQVTIPAAQLRDLLEAKGVTLPDKPEDWFGAVSYTRGGGVASWQVGDLTLTGTELRSLLELNSTRLTLQLQDGQFVFTTQGFGHRVGLSQYGAEAMARAGSGWREILTHYYTAVELRQLVAGDAV